MRVERDEKGLYSVVSDLDDSVIAGPYSDLLRTSHVLTLKRNLDDGTEELASGAKKVGLFRTLMLVCRLFGKDNVKEKLEGQ